MKRLHFILIGALLCTACADAQGPMKIITANVREQDALHTTMVDYPKLQGGADTVAVSEFNNLIQARVRNIVDDFKRTIASLPLGVASKSSALVMSYEATMPSPTQVRVLFHVTETIAGAAHSNVYTLPITYDLQLRSPQ